MNTPDDALALPEINVTLPEIPAAPESVTPDLALPDLGKIAHEANQAREKDDMALSQLVWRSAVGPVFPLKLTASKWSLFQPLASMIGRDVGYRDANRDYLESGIILFLAANPPSVWKESRDELPPLRTNFTTFLDAIEDWMDTHIEPCQMEEVKNLTERLIALTFKFEVEAVTAGEKKT